MQSFSHQNSVSDQHVLFVGDDAGDIDTCVRELAAAGTRVEPVANCDAAAERLQKQPIEVCVVLPPHGGLDSESWKRLLAEGLQNPGATQFVLLTRNGSTQTVGADAHERIDVCEWPLPTTHLRFAIHSASKRAKLAGKLDTQKTRMTHWMSRALIGHSRPMDRLRQQLAATAAGREHVVLRGEAGSGLTACSHVLQAFDSRSNAGTLYVDCRITSAEMFQRDVPGDDGATVAFPTPYGTSAAGTIVLDHVEAASLSLQDRVTALLRKSPSDIRLLVCTNSDLRELMRQGEFRDDLLHSLGHTLIEIPTLRERKEDVSPLAEHFLARVAMQTGHLPKRLSLDAVELLEEHDWPGNVGELCRLVEDLYAVEPGGELAAPEVRSWIAKPVEDAVTDTASMSLREMERKLIESTFARCKGNREQTAKQLQIGLRTLSGKLREYGYPPRGGPGSKVRATSRKAA